MDKKMKLPKPTHEMGYRQSHLQEHMTTEQWRDFIGWMRGQTVAADKGEAIYYPWDVERWNEGRPIID